jgi:hypothetical protein
VPLRTRMESAAHAAADRIAQVSLLTLNQSFHVVGAGFSTILIVRVEAAFLEVANSAGSLFKKTQSEAREDR